MSAITFPASPTNGDIYSVGGQTWRYTSAINAWEKVSGALYAITGLVEEGTNVTITGAGTIADPYVFSATADGVATIIEKDNDTPITLSAAFSCNAGPVIVLYTASGDVNLTTDPTAPVGSVWYLTPDNSGDITIVAAGGTTLHFETGAGASTNGQNSMMMVVHRAPNEFLIVGGVA
jgi:hypothetical protein